MLGDIKHHIHTSFDSFLPHNFHQYLEKSLVAIVSFTRKYKFFQLSNLCWRNFGWNIFEEYLEE